MSLDRAEVLELLYRIEEFCDQRADTRDGDYGPRPNEAMVLLGDVRELISELEDAETFGGGGGAALAQEAVSMEGAVDHGPAAPSAPGTVSLPARMPAAGSDLSSGGAPTSLAGIALDFTEGVEAAEYVKGLRAGATVSLLVLTPSDLRPGDVIVYGSGNVFEIGATRPWGSDGSYIVFPARAGGGWVAHGHERLSVRRVAVSA